MWLIRLDNAGFCPVTEWDVEWDRMGIDYSDGWVEYVHMREFEETIHFNAFGECKVVLKSYGVSPGEAVRKAQEWRSKVLDNLVRRGREQQTSVTSQTVWQEGEAQELPGWEEARPPLSDEGGSDV